MASRRRSLTSASTAAPAADDSLFHVGQRLDALAADDDHAVFYFSRVATPTRDSSHPTRNTNNSNAHNSNNSNNANDANRNANRSRRMLLSSTTANYPSHQTRANASTTSRRRRRPRRLLGLSPFYARAALLAGAAWAVAAFAVVATTATMGETPSALWVSGTPLESSTGMDRDKQTAHELGALSAGVALGVVLGGSLGDHYGRRPLLLAATACGAAALVLAGGVAWCHAALLAARALQGLALGAQLVLFPIALGELAAQRRRGRVIVAALAGVPVGALLAIHTAKRLALAVGWRVFTAALLGAAQSLVLVALALLQRESPRFLAAIGRVETALTLVAAVERAHGIDRNARVQMPSTLFAPPLQRDDGVNAEDSDENDCHDRVSTRTPTPTLPLPFAQGNRRRRTSAALTPRTVSLGVSLRKRWRRVLFCAPYARRSLGLALLWVLVAGGLSTTVGAASRFMRGSIVDVPALLSTYVAAAGALGLLTSAVVVDRCGRVPLFLLSVLVSSLATTLVGMQLFLHVRATALLSVACALLAFAAVVALGTAVLWTLESYGVLIRATGMGLAFTGLAVGVGAGQWLAWSPWLSAAAAPFALWGVAAAFIGLAVCTWLAGDETRGLEDVDAVVMMAEQEGPLPQPPSSDGSDKPTLRVHHSRRHSHHSRNTYHSKGTTHDTHDDEVDAEEAEAEAEAEAAAQRRRGHNGSRNHGRPLPTGASANSDASTFISSGSRSSSARFSSVRFSQRTLSGGHSSAGRGSHARTSSRTHSRHRQHSQPVPASSSYRHRDNLLTRGDQTPPFVIRRSSLSRSCNSNSNSSRSGGRRSSSSPGERPTPSQQRRLQDQQPRATVASARFSFSNLTTQLPARLDPHSVREHLGRRSSDADRSSCSRSSHSCEDLRHHDVMTIDIDPYEDDDDRGAFVTMPTPMPMLG